MQRRYVNQPNYERGDKRRGVGGLGISSWHTCTRPVALSSLQRPPHPPAPLHPTTTTATTTLTNACRRSLCLIWTKPVSHSARAISHSSPLVARRSSSIPRFLVVFSQKKLATCAAKLVVKTLCSHPDRTVTAQRIYRVASMLISASAALIELRCKTTDISFI